MAAGKEIVVKATCDGQVWEHKQKYSPQASIGKDVNALILQAVEVFTGRLKYDLFGFIHTEGPKTKRFHKSNTLVYIYNTIDFTPLTGNKPIVYRESKSVYATAGVTWQDIAKEFLSATNSPGSENLPMMTVMVNYPEFAVALTRLGFSKQLEKSSRYTRDPYEDLVEHLAKEMVATRDYEKWHKVNEGQFRKFMEFWPKN
jgi:hypothetical protein